MLKVLLIKTITRDQWQELFTTLMSQCCLSKRHKIIILDSKLKVNVHKRICWIQLKIVLKQSQTLFYIIEIQKYNNKGSHIKLYIKCWVIAHITPFQTSLCILIIEIPELTRSSHMTVMSHCKATSTSLPILALSSCNYNYSPSNL